MEIIKRLESGQSLASICEEFSLKRVDHEDGRTILVYDQIASPKKHPVVAECRGLVIDRFAGEVVAKPFSRFFNWGEWPEEHAKFDWSSAEIQEKLDGSLIVAYWWMGEWRFNTRGSFGDGMCGESGKSWSEIVKDILGDRRPRTDTTWCLELCSPWNQVVAFHPVPKLYLLAGFDKTGGELSPQAVDEEAHRLRVERPKRYSLSSASDCVEFLKRTDVAASFEGFVARDKNGMRVKIKNARYVALHHLNDNGNLYLTKNLVPLILAGETDEVLQYFPAAKDRILEVQAEIERAKCVMMGFWEGSRNINDQKEFALTVRNCKLSGILFAARKLGKCPLDVLRDSPDYVLKALFPKER